MIEEFSGQFIAVKNFCLEKQLFKDNSTAIIALSGGADSVYLFYFLIWLKERNIYRNFKLVAAHLNHQIRAEADQDQAFVEELCRKYQIPLCLKKVDIPNLARERKNGIEEAGRFARYTFFEEIKKQLEGTCQDESEPCRMTGHDFVQQDQENQLQSEENSIFIVLGHHQDDLAESVLLNIGRGSGFSGISTLKAKDQAYRRPLLCINKSQIYDLLKARQWCWLEDQSNQSDDYLRNRIRHQLIPQWNDIVGYDIKPVLARLAMNFEKDEAAFQYMYKKTYTECLANPKELYLRRIQKLPVSLLKAVLDFWLKENGYQQKIITSLQFDQICRIVYGEHGNKKIQIGNGIEFIRMKNRFVLSEEHGNNFNKK